MAGFLYFKPLHARHVTRGDLAQWHLGYAFPRGVQVGLCQANTPSGAAGTVFGDPQRLGEYGVRMDMAAQQWQKVPKSDVWVGYWREAKPQPAQLAREPQIPGYAVKLADGQEWQIPLVRRFDTLALASVSNLPCYMECDDDGNWHRGELLQEHAHLWALTQPIADALLANYVEQRENEPTDAQVFGAAVGLLQANYVVGSGELSLMRAFTNEARTHAAVSAGCDWPTFVAWAENQKKSAPQPTSDGSTTSAGEAG